MKILAHLDLSKNELQNAVIQPLATAPTSPKLGQIYYDSTDSKLKQYNGSSWINVGVVVSSSSTNGNLLIDGKEVKVYELPAASASTLGGITVGSGLKIESGNKVSVDTVDNLTSEDASKALSAAQGRALKQSIDRITNDLGNLGGGDMLKATYDSDNDGVVDNAAKLGGQSPNYYAAATDIPTALSQLSNDAGFIKNTVENLTNYYPKSETLTKTEITTLLGNLSTIQIEVVGELPSTGKSNVIYLTSKSSSENLNAYDEYLWNGTAFEKIGDTSIDLTPYAKTEDLADVATSGDYEDLVNKPSRLVVKTLTLEAGSLTASASVPNFAGYVSAHHSTSGEGIICDWKYISNTFTVEINEPQNYNITVLYNVTESV